MLAVPSIHRDTTPSKRLSTAEFACTRSRGRLRRRRPGVSALGPFASCVVGVIGDLLGEKGTLGFVGG
jgi:hypothetical protein